MLSAAGELFVLRGYTGTTVEAIARRSQVSVQTIYNTVGGKPAILKSVYDMFLAGDGLAIPISERPAARAMREVRDPATFLHLYAEMSSGIVDRLGGLLPVLITEAAAGNRDTLRVVEAIEAERAAGAYAVAKLFAARFGLRPGLSISEAADLLWTLTSPDLANRLLYRRGWSLPRWSDWLAQMMAVSLIGTP